MFAHCDSAMPVNAQCPSETFRRGIGILLRTARDGPPGESFSGILSGNQGSEKVVSVAAYFSAVAAAISPRAVNWIGSGMPLIVTVNVSANLPGLFEGTNDNGNT